jgi:hypothetical protein
MQMYEILGIIAEATYGILLHSLYRDSIQYIMRGEEDEKGRFFATL